MVLTSNWTVLCLDHELKLLWKSQPIKHKEDNIIIRCKIWPIRTLHSVPRQEVNSYNCITSGARSDQSEDCIQYLDRKWIPIPIPIALVSSQLRNLYYSIYRITHVWETRRVGVDLSNCHVFLSACDTVCSAHSGHLGGRDKINEGRGRGPNLGHICK